MAYANNNLFALLDDENEDPQAMAAKLPVTQAEKPVAVAKAADQGAILG